MGNAAKDAGAGGGLSPGVFISYAHDDRAHEERVRQLWLFLRANGIDAQLDVTAAQQRQEWGEWMTRQVRDAAIILVVASPAYKERAEGDAGPGEGRGLQWEARLIRERLYTDQQQGLTLVLPVVLPGCSEHDLPLWLAPVSATFYLVRELTVAGAEDLLRALTSQPRETVPVLGPVPDLPPRGHQLTAGHPPADTVCEALRPGDRDVPGTDRPMLTRHHDPPSSLQVHHLRSWGARLLRCRVVTPLALLTALVTLTVSVAISFRIRAEHANYWGPGTGYVAVRLLPGESPASLAARLAGLGVIEAAAPFVTAARDSTHQITLPPGYVRLRYRMNARRAWALLLSPASRIQPDFTIPPGARISQIAGILSSRTGYPAMLFTSALAETAALGLPSYARGHPQGYLFPGTFAIRPTASPASLLKEMTARYRLEVDGTGLPAETSNPIVENHLIIVASLVQAEGASVSNFPKIARVIYNRLKLGLKLDLDSTVKFALSTYSPQISAYDKNIRSPYNTFRHAGLPPGPIGSPGAAAILAALHPAPGTWVSMMRSPQTNLLTFEQASTKSSFWSRLGKIALITLPILIRVSGYSGVAALAALGG
jgi:UPF0755 protein